MTPEGIAFKERRPNYLDQHVREIEALCRLSEIPFCTTCADWHNENEPHSEE